jgi:hypothetical protein
MSITTIFNSSNRPTNISDPLLYIYPGLQNPRTCLTLSPNHATSPSYPPPPLLYLPLSHSQCLIPPSTSLSWYELVSQWIRPRGAPWRVDPTERSSMTGGSSEEVAVLQGGRAAVAHGEGGADFTGEGVEQERGLVELGSFYAAVVAAALSPSPSRPTSPLPCPRSERPVVPWTWTPTLPQPTPPCSSSSYPHQTARLPHRLSASPSEIRLRSASVRAERDGGSGGMEGEGHQGLPARRRRRPGGRGGELARRFPTLAAELLVRACWLRSFLHLFFPVSEATFLGV